MLSQRTIVVGDDEFVLRQFPTSVGLKYGISVGKIIGGMIAGGLAGDDTLTGEGDLDLVDDMDVGGMVEGLLSQLDEEKTPKLIKSMLKDAIAAYTFEGTKRTAWDETWYETRFMGQLEDLMTLMAAIFQDNFLKAVDVAKKKVLPVTSPKSLEDSNGANGSDPLETESQRSFFDPS